MKIIRYSKNEEIGWGILDNKEIYQIEGDLSQEVNKGDYVASLDAVKLLAPCQPSKVIALAYNYKDLVGFKDQYDEPLIFFKSPSSVIAWNEAIKIPDGFKKVWGEVEIAFVVKKIAKNISIEDAPDYILGYTIANDVTAENVHQRDHHLARAKGLDTFCPVGPFIETQLDCSALTLTTEVNGRKTQQGNSKNRILNDAETLSLISRFITLYPGDLILTGTPAGAMDSLIKSGDTIQLTVEHLGEIKNLVI